jgi:hypothetical protein
MHTPPEPLPQDLLEDVGRSKRWLARLGLAGGIALAATPLSAWAGQTTGVPGSPSATTSIDGRQLPAPDPAFGGVIKDNALTGVDDADYRPPFPLTAKLNKLTLKVNRPQLSPEEIKKLEDGMKKVAAGKE